MQNIDEVVELFKRDLLEIVLEELERISLKGSNIYNQTQVIGNSSFIQLEINEYIIHIDLGRRIKAKYIPINVLLKWVIKNRIRFAGKTNLQVAFIIQRSIYKKGIKARPVLKNINRKVDELIRFQDNRFSELLTNILDSLPKN